MKLRKTISKTSIVLCAAVLAGAPLASNPEAFHLSNIAITAEAASTVSFSSPETINTILQRTTPSEASLRTALNKVKKKYKNFHAIYTTQSDSNCSNFILIYNNSDVRLDELLNTPQKKGSAWAIQYGKFLKTLERLSGVQFEYTACILDTTVEEFDNNPAYSAGTCTYYARTESLGLITGIMNNQFTHCLIHETSHGFTISESKSLFNSDDEVYTNFRAICALHKMGLEKDKIMLANTTAYWKKTPDNINDKLTGYKPKSDIIKYLPSTSKIRQNLDTTEYVTVSPVQMLAYFAIGGAENNYFTRLSTIFSYCADKPIWYSYNTTSTNCNNWLNTAKINENWDSIAANQKWSDLYALCISKVGNVPDIDASGNFTAYICLMKDANRRNGTGTTITYEYNDKNYTVLITKKAKKILNQICTPTSDGVYHCSGNLIQGCNMLDFLSVSTTQTISTKVFSKTVKDYYKYVLLDHCAHKVAYIAPEADPNEYS